MTLRAAGQSASSAAAAAGGGGGAGGRPEPSRGAGWGASAPAGCQRRRRRRPCGGRGRGGPGGAVALQQQLVHATVHALAHLELASQVRRGAPGGASSVRRCTPPPTALRAPLAPRRWQGKLRCCSGGAAGAWAPCRPRPPSPRRPQPPAALRRGRVDGRAAGPRGDLAAIEARLAADGGEMVQARAVDDGTGVGVAGRSDVRLGRAATPTSTPTHAHKRAPSARRSPPARTLRPRLCAALPPPLTPQRGTSRPSPSPSAAAGVDARAVFDAAAEVRRPLRLPQLLPLPCTRSLPPAPPDSG